ncbi:MAG: alcohol dehydrogenase catalytic domain-containing protein [Nitrososphaerota archaeon]|nr:alcohol dehydrogenase catalytic domain-containing protein [Nitrososphaerota archaeon]
MKSVLVGEKGYVVADLDLPAPGPGEVLVKMLACGLCGTDVEKLEGRYKGSKPVIGHEAAGLVAAVGEGVTGLRVGELVVPHHHVNCGKCYYCLKDSPTMCPSYREYNFIPGGFSEYFIVPRYIVEKGGIHKPLQDIDPLHACLTEPTACILRALDRASAHNPESYAVIGLGAIGLTFIQILKWRGIERIVGLDINPLRVEAAEKYGATALNPTLRDPLSEVKEMTDGRGVDVAVVAAGSPAALAQAIRLTRRGGLVLLFAIPPHGSTLQHDISDLIVREVSIIPSNAATDIEMREALNLISNKIIDVEGLITHRYEIDKFGEALHTFKSGNGIKIVLTP